MSSHEKAAALDTVVIGAGVVGMATALFLQRSGQNVTVVDPYPPAGGASFGNAGMISANNASPIAMPGMLSLVPGWLFDRNGPLILRKRFLLKTMPWLAKWIRSGRIERVLKISDALHALNRDTHAHWKTLVGSSAYDRLIHRSGQVHLSLDGDMPSRNAASERQIRERHGLPVELLARSDIARMFPGIAADITRGVLIPGNGFTVNPAKLVAAIGTEFLWEGGTLVSEKALKLIPRDGQLMVMTNVSNHLARNVIVAAGIWSTELLEPLGIKVPLQSERGYHAMLPDHNLDLRHALTVRSRGVGMTPMDTGLRVTGTVEFTGVNSPPDETLPLRYVANAKKIFPDIRHGAPTLWMGMRPSTPDSLPIIDTLKHVPGLHLAFGNGHGGMTGGPGTARLAADQVLGIKSAIDPSPYRLARFLS
jgi:D-amino-acid dehydrogenase